MKVLADAQTEKRELQRGLDFLKVRYMYSYSDYKIKHPDKPIYIDGLCLVFVVKCWKMSKYKNSFSFYKSTLD